MDGVVTDKAALNKLGLLPDGDRQHTIEQLRAGEYNSTELAKPKKKQAKQPVSKDPNILRLENQLSEQLGAPFTIHHNDKKGSGSVRFHYSSLEQLEGLLDRFQISRDD